MHPVGYPKKEQLCDHASLCQFLVEACRKIKMDLVMQGAELVYFFWVTVKVPASKKTKVLLFYGIYTIAIATVYKAEH